VSVAFLVTTLVVVVSPGTGVVYTLAAGLSRGRRASVVAAFGCTLGILPHIAAALLGLAALMYTSSIAFQTLKIAGVLYLLVLALRTWRDHGALQIEAGRTPRSARHVIVSAVAVNVLNPKLSVFFVAFLPQFVRSDDASRLAHMLELSGVFMLMTFVVFVTYGLAAAWMRMHVVGRPRVLNWLRRVFAATFVGLGVKLATTQR
jgi:threonine/homoserine/homoserine lactone efflux protein